MEFEDNIRRVTVREIREELESMMKLPPTFVVRGDDTARNIGNESLWKKKLGGR
jgi:ABC-type tungstate transport system permease subunit